MIFGMRKFDKKVLKSVHDHVVSDVAILPWEI